MSFLIYDLNKTEKKLAQSLITGPMNSANIHLDHFFEPVKDVLLTVRDQAIAGHFDSISSDLMNGYFVPLIQNFKSISSIGLANTDGYEYDVLPSDTGWHHRIVWVDSLGETEFWQHWVYHSGSRRWQQKTEWSQSVKHDPRIRPWFTGALNSSYGDISWTEPYVYNTNGELGITASTKWNRLEDDRTHIIAVDLTLT